MNKIYLITLLTQDHKGVLNRITSVIRRRQFDICTVAANSTELKGVTRVTFLVQGKSDIDQLIKQVYKIVEVTKVVELKTETSIMRELALVKIGLKESLKSDLLKCIDAFDGEILDAMNTHISVQIVGNPQKIDSFVNMVKSFGIITVTRSGVVALRQGL